MLGYLMGKWGENNQYTNEEGNFIKPTPLHVLYFRDGVSESQYDAVGAHEVNRIRHVFHTHFDGAYVMITAVICTKRHHTRFYNELPIPVETRGRPSNRNTKPDKSSQMLSE